MHEHPFHELKINIKLGKFEYNLAKVFYEFCCKYNQLHLIYLYFDIIEILENKLMISIAFLISIIS